MSLLLTFMELGKLYESTNRLERSAIIRKIKELGKEYNFDKYSDEQLYRMLERAQKATEEKAAIQEYSDLLSKGHDISACVECGATLTDGGLCPVCDDGEETYFDEALLEWVDSSGKKVNSSVSTAISSTSNLQQAKKAENIITIVYDSTKHKLRAQADDGIHGIGYVAFPNDLRTKEGQQYKVETLIWNGKNYRVSGNIEPI